MVKSFRSFIVVLVLASVGLLFVLLRHGSGATVAPLIAAPAPSIGGVLTFHNDIASTGWNSKEMKLSPATVRTGIFGKRYTTPVDAQVYAQPLVATGVTIGKGVNTKGGAEGVHDVVYIATQKGSLYAIDAGPSGGTILWERSFLNTENGGGNQNNTLNANTINVLSNDDVHSGDMAPNICITGTPVIDPATSTYFVLVKTKESVGGATHFVQRMHAINMTDGTDRVQPYGIGDTTNGNDNTTSIFVFGTGDGSVVDKNGTGKKIVEFNALKENHRGALNLVNGTLYAQWASHGDNGPYHGWVVAWDIRHLTTAGFKVTGVLNVSPNSGESGIWQSAGRLAFEPDGSAFYFETGNGNGPAPTLNADGFPANAAYNEALVKVAADPTTTPEKQNPNGWGLKIADYFIPFNVLDLDHADSDFGSGAPVLLPDTVGIPGHPHLMVGGGKDGKMYVFDRDHLGHFDRAGDHVLNVSANGRGNTPDKYLAGLLSTPAYFNGKVYAVGGFNGQLYAFRIEQNGALTVTSQSNLISFGYLAGSPAISSNGATNGIVWMEDRQQNQLRAFDADTMSTELWDSSQRADGGDTLGAVVKYAIPTIYNGRVYVGTSDSLVVYGMAQPPNAALIAPVLTAAPLWNASANLTWTDASRSPNIATAGYVIEQSSDNAHFTKVATAPAAATSIAIGQLAKLTKYYFRIQGVNSIGGSPYSNISSATTTNQAPSINFANGFDKADGTLKLNGSTVNKKNLRLTDGGANEAASAYFIDPVDITGFTTRFTFKLNRGNAANGFTFVVQNAGPAAVGKAGAALGYGTENTGEQGGITKSVAIKFDVASGRGQGPSSTGIYFNGAPPTDTGSVDLRPSGLDLHTGDSFDVSIDYDGTTLTAQIKNTKTGKSDSHDYPVDIQKIVGANTAYVGFTGGTPAGGGRGMTAEILQWTLAPSASTSPNAPSGLGAVAASATSIKLNWTSNAPSQAGYHLDRATDAAFTKNFVKINVPRKPAMFTDTATGLAPGTTYYYRLRAYNAAGDSGNSNVAHVSIPLAPPKPSNQKIDAVTATEISMTWQDNAGHQTDGYKILRAANHGAFSVVATLPPTSRPAPSPYSWTDTMLTPGTYYEYHIVAYNVSGSNDFAGTNATTSAAPAP